MSIKLKVPDNLQKQIMSLEDYPGYINKKQLAKACEVSMGTLDNWNRTRDDIPIYDLKNGSKIYWRPETIAPFIEIYRRKNNKPLA